MSQRQGPKTVATPSEVAEQREVIREQRGTLPSFERPSGRRPGSNRDLSRRQPPKEEET